MEYKTELLLLQQCTTTPYRESLLIHLPPLPSIMPAHFRSVVQLDPGQLTPHEACGCGGGGVSSGEREVGARMGARVGAAAVVCRDALDE